MQNNERDIIIDNIPCFREITVPIKSLKGFGVNQESIRVYLPLIGNLPLSTYSDHLFTSYGYSKSDAGYYYNLIQTYLALGSIISLKSGKNPYWNQSFMIFRESTLLYKKALNEDLRNLFSKKSIREYNKYLNKIGKDKMIDNAKEKIRAGLNSIPNEDFRAHFRKAIYEKLESVELTPKGFEIFKAEIIDRINNFSKHYNSNLKHGKNNKEILLELKKTIIHEYSDDIRSSEVDNLLKKVDLILSKVKWHESNTGATIFVNPLDDYPKFYEDIDTIIEDLREILLKFQVSKKSGLKGKVNQWLSLLEAFQSDPDLVDQSLTWIKNEFSSKTNALRRISLEGKLYYNKLISLFCKKSLILIQKNESLSEYETRLFILMNTAQSFCDYHLVVMEPIFFNYLIFSKAGALKFLFAHIFRFDTELKIHFYTDLIQWLKFFPIWKNIIREEDLNEKRNKRKSQKESPLVIDPKDPNLLEEEISEISVNYDLKSVSDFFEQDGIDNLPFQTDSVNKRADENDELMYISDENLEKRDKKDLIEKMIRILEKYGKPIHVEVFNYLLTNKNLSLFARKKGKRAKTKQYYSKIKLEAQKIIQNNYTEI